MTRRLAFGAAMLLAAGLLSGQTTPTPGPAKPKSKPKASSAKAPLDFTGVWVLDAEASSGVSPQMTNAVLDVRQTGNRIWIEQIGTANRGILSEQIVVDGRKYEKALGAGQVGTLESDWGKDGTSLWLQVVAGAEGEPSSAVQRMVWRLRDGGKTWTRQSKTIQPDGVRETFLVFRKRSSSQPGAPTPPKRETPTRK
jgi:hypothetical protein